MKPHAVLPVLLLALLAAGASAQTYKGGLILANETWNFAGSPYIVTQSIIIGANATVTIDHGVQVRFATLTGLVVGSSMFGPGTLVARGSASQQITFTADGTGAPGFWNQLVFSDYAVDAAVGGSGQYLSGSALEHCVVEYGGNSSPAVMLEKSSPYLRDTIIRRSTKRGLKADMTNGTTTTPLLRLTDCEIHNCAQGGVEVSGGTGHEVRGNEIHDNTGGHGLSMSSCPSSLVTENIIERNSSGSGLSIVSSANITVSRNSFAENSGSSWGGGALVDSCGNAAVEDNVVRMNTCSSGGGGLCIYGSNGCSVVRNLVVGNSADNGGGIRVTWFLSNATIIDNTIVGNHAGSSGGGLSLTTNVSSTQLSRNSIAANSAGSNGGGLYVADSNSCTVVDSHFSDNVAAGKGGAVYFAGGGLTLTNCGIALNTATDGGGFYVNAAGLQIAGDPVANVFNTIVDNSATRGSAVFLNTAYGANLSATHVCWGTTNVGAVPAMIWDFFDNSSLGLVVFVDYGMGVGIATSDPLYSVGGEMRGTTGVPVLTGSGTLVPGSPTLLSLTNAAPSAPMVLLFGFAPMWYTDYLDLLIVPMPAVIMTASTNASGGLDVPFSWPYVPSGFQVFWQALIYDPGSPNGTASCSNAIYSVSP
ncbi:MAG: right-handed parallel beta-helix repeat-containing protein [Planctomycetes bacterium]|nr:right-handed parallel beta-helix repeat-containing protein [Planctomycetota bacterium]